LKFHSLTKAGERQLHLEVESWEKSTALVARFLDAKGAKRARHAHLSRTSGGPCAAIMILTHELDEGRQMRRFSVGLVLMTMAIACASGCQTPAHPQVTAKGSEGDEDVPDLTIRQVSLKAGETLLVSCNDEGGDVAVTWGGASLHQDVATSGNTIFTYVFTLYSATGGTGDIVASHASRGDLSINAYSITDLASSALDKSAAAQGMSVSPSSGATATTSHANEFLWGTIGYASNEKAAGTWNDGFTSGAQYTNTGGIGGVEDGYKTVSSTGAYVAAKAGVDKDYWTALIVTYATTAGRGR
jgi:hypothetical protein